MFGQEVHRKIYIYCSFLAVFMIPLHEKWAMLPFFIAFLNFFVEGQWSAKIERLSNHRILAISSVYYLIHVVGLIHSSNFDYAGFDIETKTSFLLIPIIVGGSAPLSIKEFRTILISSLAGLFVGTFICYGNAIYQQINGGENHFYYKRLTSILKMHQVYFAFYINIGILFLFYFLFSFRNLKWFLKGALIFGILYLTFFNLLLSARLQILMMTVLVSGGILIHFILNRKVLIGVAGTLVYLAFLYFASQSMVLTNHRFVQLQNMGEKTEKKIDMRVDDSQEWNGVNARIAMWKAFPDLIKDYWFIGTGTGDVGDVMYEKWDEIGFDLGVEQKFNLHNQYLQSWLAFGVFGIITLLAWLLIPFIRALKHELWLTIAFLLLIGGMMLSEVMFNVQVGVVPTLYFYCIFLVHDNLRLYNTTE